MARRERDKGRKGEAEVAAIYRGAGFEVRGLEGTGDHLVICDPHGHVVLHSETKRQETARPWAWWEQASSQAPLNSIPVVHFRRSRSPWLALLAAHELLGLLVALRDCRAALARAHAELVELRGQD